MSWWKRGIRILRVGLLIIAGLSLALYGLSVPKAWWKPPVRLFLYAWDGQFTVEWWGPRARVSKPKAPAGFGFPKGFSVTFNSPGIIVDQGEGWLWDWAHHRPNLTSPTRYSTMLNIHLDRLAMVTGPLGIVLLLVRAKRPRPGSCPKCDYDLAGLAAGAACPECGSAFAVQSAPSLVQ